MSTFGSLPSITATTEFVVPRSIPMIFAILVAPSRIFSGQAVSSVAAPQTLLPGIKQVPCQRGPESYLVITVRFNKENQ
jgi:hypothetical protein